MKTRNILPACEFYFKDGDYISEENYVLINNQDQIVRNGNRLTVKGNISTGHPRVRIISEDLFLLVDSDEVDHSGKKTHNAWIINSQGKIEQSYFLGNVHQMILSPKHIIVSKPEASIDMYDPYQDTLVVFDFEGNILYTFAKDEKSPPLGLIENHAFLEKDETTIYYMPYSGPDMFPVIELNLVDFSSTLLFNLAEFVPDVEDPFWFPNGFSKKEGDWYFATYSSISDSPDQPFSRIFKLNETREVEEIGRSCYSVYPKGMKNGDMFLPFAGSNDAKKRCQLLEF